MFKNIYFETEVKNDEYAKNILNFFSSVPQKEIERVDQYFGKVKKPYLHKRTDLNLFLGKKRGNLIKKAPEAYGTESGEHYYFVHAYNCIYECEYCYLQGYFHSPDIVLFTNHDQIIDEMRELSHNKEEVWFHAGEFSDSLALSHITNEWEQYWEFFKKTPQAKLELRSKSTNIKTILALEPLPNTLITFSLSCTESAKKFDRKVPGTSHRLKAISELVKKGFRIGIHLDPMIYSETFESDYLTLIEELKKHLPDENLEYLSLGVVRFTKDVYRQVQMNYPDSEITKQPVKKSFDGKVRYSRPLRGWMLSLVEKILIDNGYSEEKIYRCME